MSGWWESDEASMVNTWTRREQRLEEIATELLAALKRCLPAIRMYANDNDCEAAEAAILKAEVK